MSHHADDRRKRQGGAGPLEQVLRVSAGILMWPLLVYLPVAVVLLIGGIGNLVTDDALTPGLWLGAIGLPAAVLGVWCYRVTTDRMRRPLQLLLVFLQSS